MPDTRNHPPGYVGVVVRGEQVRVGDLVNFGYPELGFTEVVAIEDAVAEDVADTRYALMADGSRRALFGWTRAYSVDRP